MWSETERICQQQTYTKRNVKGVVQIEKNMLPEGNR